MNDKENQKLRNLLIANVWATDDEMGKLGCLLAPVLIGVAFFLWWYSN